MHHDLQGEHETNVCFTFGMQSKQSNWFAVLTEQPFKKMFTDGIFFPRTLHLKLCRHADVVMVSTPSEKFLFVCLIALNCLP